MEKRIRDRFSDAILRDAADAYGILPEDLTSLGGFESFIYRFSSPEGGRILRLAHSIRRTPELIRGEVEFIRYLTSGGISAADVVPAVSGDFVKEIPDGSGGSFLATAFREINGVTPWEAGWSDELFFSYGSTMGAMHRLSRVMPAMKDPRPSWNSPELCGDVAAMIPADQTRVRQRISELEDTALGLPSDTESYGMVHYDVHCGNMLIDPSGRIHLFDFDDCCESWFINDIAIALFYSVTNVPEPEKTAERFLRSFFQGYSTENRLSSHWLDQIGLFLSIREADLYAVIHRSMNINSLDRWCAGFMEGRRERIEMGRPYLDMDFRQFAEFLS